MPFRAALACRALQPSPLQPELLVQLHRYAVLLVGDLGAAEDLLLMAIQQCGGQSDQFRHERQWLALLVKKLRELAGKCKRASAEVSAAPEGVEALARAFAQIPEPARSALALLYAGLFPLPEIASLLGLTIDETCEKLSAARTALNAEWKQRPWGESPGDLFSDQSGTEAPAS